MVFSFQRWMFAMSDSFKDETLKPYTSNVRVVRWAGGWAVRRGGQQYAIVSGRQSSKRSSFTYFSLNFLPPRLLFILV